jgi:hypothetical protein
MRPSADSAQPGSSHSHPKTAWKSTKIAVYNAAPAPLKPRAPTSNKSHPKAEAVHFTCNSIIFNMAEFTDLLAKCYDHSDVQAASFWETMKGDILLLCESCGAKNDSRMDY